MILRRVKVLEHERALVPADMKDLMNKVIEAQKAAEAALITRREETAAMRSQANTARLIEQNPTLMRLRESAPGPWRTGLHGLVLDRHPVAVRDVQRGDHPPRGRSCDGVVQFL